MKKRVSIVDIANYVGTSTAAVSYVLSGKAKEKRLSKELIQKIEKAAKELNYKPNLIARSLRQGTSNIIALILPDISNTFFSEMARFIEIMAYEMGYSLLIGNTDEDAHKSALVIEVMESRQVDGYIIAPSEGTEEQIQSLINKRKPVVLVDRILSSLDVSRVILDNYKASYDACNYLFECGYQNIAAIGYKSTLMHMHYRFQGYTDALRDNKSGFRPRSVEIGYHNAWKEMQKVMKRILNAKQRTDAILFLTNTLALYGLSYFVNNNVKVPKDVAVIGFDGNIAFDVFTPALTYVEQPLKEICNQALKCLKNQLDGENLIAQIKVEGKLVIRDSCKKQNQHAH